MWRHYLRWLVENNAEIKFGIHENGRPTIRVQVEYQGDTHHCTFFADDLEMKRETLEARYFIPMFDQIQKTLELAKSQTANGAV